MTTVTARTNFFTTAIDYAKQITTSFCPWLTKVTQLTPDLGFGTQQAPNTAFDDKVAQVVKNQLISSSPLQDRTTLIQANYDPDLIDSLKKFFNTTDETTRFKAVQELFKGVDDISYEKLAEKLKDIDSKNHTVIFDALWSKGINGHINKLREQAVANTNGAGNMLTVAAKQRLVDQMASITAERANKTFTISDDAVITGAISTKLSKTAFDAHAYLSALAKDGPKAALAYSYDCIEKLQKEINDTLDRGITSSSASPQIAKQVNARTMKAVTDLRAQQILIAKLISNKDIFGEEVVGAIKAHATAHPKEAIERMNVLTENKIDHVNTLAHELITKWNGNTTDPSFQITATALNNSDKAVKQKIKELEKRLATAQATAFTGTSKNILQELEAKLDINTAGKLAKKQGANTTEKALAAEFDEALRKGLTNTDVKVRINTFCTLLQKVNAITDTAKKDLILTHIDSTLGITVPRTLNTTAMQELVTIGEHLDKLKAGHNTVQNFLDHETAQHMTIYHEMYQSLTGTTLSQASLERNINDTRRSQAKPPITLPLAPTTTANVNGATIATYLRSLTPDAAGNVTIPAYGANAAYVIAKSKLDLAIKKIEAHSNPTTMGGKIKVSSGTTDVKLSQIAQRCTNLIAKSSQPKAEVLAGFLSRFSEISGNITIPGYGTEAEIVVPKANMDLLINHFKATGSTTPISVQDSNGLAVHSDHIAAHCTALIESEYSSYTTPAAKSEAYHADYEPQLYRDYKKQDIYDYILSAWNQFMKILETAGRA